MKPCLEVDYHYDDLFLLITKYSHSLPTRSYNFTCFRINWWYAPVILIDGLMKADIIKKLTGIYRPCRLTTLLTELAIGISPVHESLCF
jgi:hypothetical protein